MKNKAFTNGLISGLAPTMLYTDYLTPTTHYLPSSYAPLYRPAKTSTEALKSDMARVGGDFRKAIIVNGKG